jgi:hypothetical protein
LKLFETYLTSSIDGLSVGGTGTRRGSGISTLTTPSKILAHVDVDDLDDDIRTLP